MKLTIKRKINKAVVDIELDERDEKIAMGKAITLSVEDHCDNCGDKDNIVWKQNKAESEKGSFIYIKRKCLKCGAESTLREYTGQMGYFWSKFEIYQKQGSGWSNQDKGHPTTNQAPNSQQNLNSAQPEPYQNNDIHIPPYNPASQQENEIKIEDIPL